MGVTRYDGKPFEQSNQNKTVQDLGDLIHTIWAVTMSSADQNPKFLGSPI